MLTFECCLQQLLGLCIKRLDFILLSTRLPHGHPAPAALYRAGTSDSTWEGEAKGEASGVERKAGDPSLQGLGGAGQRLEQVLLGSRWHLVFGCEPKLGFWWRSGTSQAPVAGLRNPCSFWDYTRVKS